MLTYDLSFWFTVLLNSSDFPPFLESRELIHFWKVIDKKAVPWKYFNQFLKPLERILLMMCILYIAVCSKCLLLSIPWLHWLPISQHNIFKIPLMMLSCSRCRCSKYFGDRYTPVHTVAALCVVLCNVDGAWKSLRNPCIWFSEWSKNCNSYWRWLRIVDRFVCRRGSALRMFCVIVLIFRFTSAIITLVSKQLSVWLQSAFSCPVWGRGTLPFSHCPFTSSSFVFLLFPFFHWLYLFSSFVHPFPFYQNSPTQFPGRRS